LAESISTFNCRADAKNTALYAIDTPEELEAKITSAHRVHISKHWQNPDLRRQFFSSLIEALEHNKAALNIIYCSESSLSDARFEREFYRTLHQISTYSNEGYLWSKHRESVELPHRFLEKFWIPIGPVVVFGASNFPLAYGTLGGDTIGALAAGCPVLVKGHSLHAGTSTLLAKITSEVLVAHQLPLGVFGHILDKGFRAGQRLIMDERIKVGAFTGSISGGMSLFKLAQNRKTPIPFFAEMGSLNPVIVLRNSNTGLENWKNLANAVTEDAGQFCTKPGLILVPVERMKEIKTKLREELERNPSYPMLHPEIYNKYEAKLKDLEQVIPVTRFSNNTPWNGDRAIASCTLQEFMDAPKLHEELFGPFTCLIGYSRLEEIESLYRCIGGQLTTTFIGIHPEKERIWSIAQEHSGRIVVNGVPTGVEVNRIMNHGGPFPASTDVRYSSVGEASIQRFLRPVSVQINSAGLKKSLIL
jgi:NADP-dependent aldehyde dehydrogenase